eukprot:m.85418 g.85418  ORF g.85418 m.85418 type:complete len:282 (-) comp19778_c0_seq4:147-992(-)
MVMQACGVVVRLIGTIGLLLGRSEGGLSTESTPPPGFVVQISADTPIVGAPPQINITKLPGAGGSNNFGFLTTITNGHPHFRALPPFGGHPCGIRTKTSVTAEHAGCSIAVNGGPFNMGNGDCMGVLVHGGKVLEGATAGGGTVFGKTTDGHWLLGDYNPSTSTLDVPEALSAFQWLVFNGTVTPTAGGEVAPRTAIGVDTKGRLVLLEVDGCEKCATGDQGLTLYGVAQLLLSHGVLNAINLDGGGSSSMVVNGSFINRPTCIDTWVPICERAVTTVVCV